MGIPLVALQSNAPEIAKGIGDIGTRQLSLRKLLDEQRANQQEIQMNDLKLQKAQQDQADEQALNRASQASGGDIDKLRQIAPQMGVSATRMMKFEEDWTKGKAAKLALSDAEFKNDQNRQQAIAQAFDGVRHLPIVAQPAGWDNAVKQLTQSGHLNPQEAQQYAQYPGPDGIKSIEIGLNFSDRLNKEATEERAASEEKRKQAAEERAALEFKWKQEHGFASTSESPKAALQRQLIDAQNKGDAATAQKLIEQLKAIDPAAQQRIVISEGNLDERKQNATRQEVREHDKAYVQPAETVEKSYQMMKDAYDEYKAAKAQGKELPTGAQSMLALATHLSTTFGNVKGARVTKDMIREHLGARGISDRALVAVQSITNGDRLSPEQWEAFFDMVSNSRKLSWDAATKEAKRKNIPVDFLPPDLSGESSASTEGEIELERGPDGKLRVKGK